jgi:hypothetical protein
MNEVVLNATNSMSSFEIAGTDSWFPILVMVSIATVLILLFVIALSNFQRYKKMKGVLAWFVNSFAYFLLGVGGLLALSVPVGIFYYLIKQTHEGNVAPLRVTLGIIAGYFTIAGFGYLIKRFITERIGKYERKLHPKNKTKEKSNVNEH